MEMVDLVYKKVLSYRRYTIVGIVVLIFGSLLSLNVFMRNQMFTNVLSSELTKSVFYLMKSSKELENLKGEIKGIHVGKGVFDKNKQKMFFSAKVYAEHGEYEVMLFYDSDGNSEHKNPTLLLIPPLVQGSKIVVLENR